MHRAMLATLVAAGSLAPAALAATTTNDATNDWAEDTVFYLAFVRSFADSTEGPLANDGVGDLRGLIEHLDDLNDGDPETDTDLGVTGLWLMPVQPATSYHGYDITDYRAINPDYGTLDDYKELVAACHQRGIRVVLDLVLNHTGRAHPWFTQAADPASDKHDWYVWSDSDPGYKGPWGQPVWHDDLLEQTGQYYYGCFHAGMPDLNYRNPAVTAEMESTAAFWLDDVGVDGFRLDAVRHLVEDGEAQASTPATLDWCRSFNHFVKQTKPSAWIVGEVWGGPGEIKPYLDGPDPALDSCFDFPLAYAIVEGLREDDAERIRVELARSWDEYHGRASTFLTNHDMDRAMSRWAGDIPKARAAITLLLTTPGVPFLYYGEEIGMEGAGPHERIRTPMQWTDDEDNAGFTAGDPWEVLGPNVRDINVRFEKRVPGSLWHLYRDLIALREAHPALAHGSFTPVDANHPGLIAFLRETAGDHPERVLVVVNVTADPIRDYAILPDAVHPGATQTLLLPSEADAGPGLRLVPKEGAWRPLELLLPHTGYVVRLGGAG